MYTGRNPFCIPIGTVAGGARGGPWGPSERPVDSGRARASVQGARRVAWAATRYDKLLVNFMGSVKLAAIAIWLR